MQFRVVTGLLVGLCAHGTFAADPPATKSAANPTAKAAPTKSEEAKKPAATKPADPLSGVPSTFALPPIYQSPPREVALGTVAISPQQIVAVSLAGGEAAPRLKPRAFVLVEPADLLTARQWQIELTPARKQDRPLPVATFSIRDGKLWFAWHPQAELDPAAALLANCVFQISAGSASKKIALRKPISGDSPRLSFHEETVAKWEIPHPPESSRLKVECNFAFRFPRHRLLGNAILKGSGEACWIEITEKEIGGLLQFQVETKSKSHLEVRATPFLVVGEKKMPYSAAMVNKQRSQLSSHIERLDAQLKLISAANAKSKGKGPTAVAPNVLKELTTQLTTARSLVKKLEVVDGFVEQFKDEIPLKTRVYFEVESTLVDVVVTK